MTAPARPWRARAAKLAGWIAAISGCGAVAGMLAVSHFAESAPITAIALYFPPAIWLLPWAVAAPLALCFNRRAFWWLALAGGHLVFAYAGLAWNTPSHPAGGHTFTVVTNNVGQANRQSLVPFLEESRPDIALLQEAQYAWPTYAKIFPERHVAGRGQFMALSKWPISDWAILESPTANGRPIAARFVLDTPHGKIAAYSVRLPTPRRELTRFSLRDALWQILDPSSLPRPRPEPTFAEAMASRLDLMRNLIATIRSEPLPYIVAGDFNIPDISRSYREARAVWTDAFASAGRGFGSTFPGYTRNPLSLGGPWLRLDYIFAGPGWTALECRVEPKRRAQHRAVFARLELADPSP